MVDVAAGVQVNELINLIAVALPVEAHLAGDRRHWVLDVLQEVLRYHVDVAAERRCASTSKVVGIHLVIHADVVRAARSLVHAPHIVHSVGRASLPVELASLSWRVHCLVAGVLCLEALRRREEAALAGAVPAWPLSSAEVRLARVDLVLLGGQMADVRGRLAADVGLVANRRRPARLPAAGVKGAHAQLRLTKLTIAHRQEGVHHWSQIQSMSLALRCRCLFLLTTVRLVDSNVCAGGSSMVLPTETTVRARLGSWPAGIRAYEIRRVHPLLVLLKIATVGLLLLEYLSVGVRHLLVLPALRVAIAVRRGFAVVCLVLLVVGGAGAPESVIHHVRGSIPQVRVRRPTVWVGLVLTLGHVLVTLSGACGSHVALGLVLRLVGLEKSPGHGHQLVHGAVASRC